ncbi:unnamed protein product [Meloidogyne enterolobii]|uniref:Uncharacterized protein n=1 Tax=Meloidogyne enterolobii TaxID=390850 RepID=A0ACB0ZSV5_MELEN
MPRVSKNLCENWAYPLTYPLTKIGTAYSTYQFNNDKLIPMVTPTSFGYKSSAQYAIHTSLQLGKTINEYGATSHH